MKKIMLVGIAVSLFSCLFLVYAQDGFVVWSKGGGCDRELHYNPITGGNKVGQEKLVIKKGPGADIWPHISYDGEWVAWCRSPSAFSGRYGKCDYHKFGTWDIYVGKINFGKTLPVKPIKIANGYLPSWAMDANAKTPGKPKTLYFTKYSDQTIQKTTINANGTFTPPVEHSRCPKKVTGNSAHTQGSPDGKYILYRPAGIFLWSVEQTKHVSDTKISGCHPCWGPRSKYFIISKNHAHFNMGSSIKHLGKAGVGSYFQGLSNDAYYDEGRLWVIGRVGGSGQNGAGSVEFKEVKISNDGAWSLGPSTKVGKGSACDIHMFPKGFDPNNPTNTIKKGTNILNKSINFTTQIHNSASGLQLVIYSMDQTGKTAELFDIQGKKIRSMKISNSLKNTLPLSGISNGRYILKISNNNAIMQKSIFISK